jgi:hypothetical protein
MNSSALKLKKIRLVMLFFFEQEPSGDATVCCSSSFVPTIFPAYM